MMPVYPSATWQSMLILISIYIPPIGTKQLLTLLQQWFKAGVQLKKIPLSPDHALTKSSCLIFSSSNSIPYGLLLLYWEARVQLVVARLVQWGSSMLETAMDLSWLWQLKGKGWKEELEVTWVPITSTLDYINDQI